MKIIFRFSSLLTLLAVSLFSTGQGEDNIWYTGTLNGGTTQGGAIDFNLATPSFVGGSYLAPSMAQAEGTASRSDAAGNLLFYTDGVDVWGANHVLMPNGTGLGGHRSSRFSALNIPDPGNIDRYYVFTNDGHTSGNGTGLHYSHIDMTLNAGIGDVIIGSKAISLLSNTSEDLTGALHCNGTDYWVIVVDHPPSTGNSDMHIYAYQVTSTGILAPVVSNLGAFGGLSLTDMFKMSPDGTKGVIRLQGGAGWTDAVLDFSNLTGGFTLNTTLNTGGRGGFSPDGQIYYASNGSLLQYDANNMGVAPLIIAGGVGSFQDYRIGPNGKIYMLNWGDVYAINNPNVSGVGCNYAGFTIVNPGMMGGPSMLPNVFLKNTGIDNCFPLPITLISFNVHCLKTSVRIEWSTLSENNNDYFTLEKSTDGLEFNEIARINGAGWSLEQLRYQYTDDYLVHTEVSYYRLSQTDYDGKTEVFNVEAVNCETSEKQILTIVDSQGKVITDHKNYRGFMIITYDDGSIEKRINVFN